MSPHPDRYERKSGGCFLMLFGLPFLIAGLAVMIFGREMKSESGKPVSPVVSILFGAVFAAAGTGLILGRKGVTLDKRTNRAVSWWGLMVPMKSTVIPLDSLTQVEITREIRRSDKSSQTVYPVRAEHTGGALSIMETQDYQAARKEAEEVAKFLGLQLSDASDGGEAKVRQADDLDKSIREQARDAGETIDVPSLPVGCRVRHELAGGRLTLEIPAPGVPKVLLIGMGIATIMPLGFIAFFITNFFEGKDVPTFFIIGAGVFGLLFLLPIIFGPGRLLLMGKSGERVIVTPESLEWSLVSPMGAKTIRLPAAEIEELELTGRGRADEEGRLHDEAHPIARGLLMMTGATSTLVARSDRETLHFGRCLNREEAQWMHALLKRVLTS